MTVEQSDQSDRGRAGLADTKTTVTAGAHDGAAGDSLNKLLRGAIDCLPGIVAVIDPSDRLVYANQLAREVWHLEPSSLPVSLNDIDRHLAHQYWLPALNRKRETGKQEVCYYTLGDHQKGVHAHIAAFLPIPSERESEFTLMVDHDVSERASLDKKIETQHVAWLEAERLGQFGTFEFSHPTSEVIASKGLLRLLGFDPDVEHPTTEQMWRRFTEESMQVAQRALAAAWESEEAQKEELMVRLPDGTSRVVFAQATALRDETGAPIKLMGYCHDVTEQRELEQALRISERKYRSLLDSSTQFLLVVQDAQVVYINPHAAKSLGYSVESLSHSSFMGFVYPDDRQLAGEMYQRRLNGEPVPERYELRVVKSNGEVACCEISGVPFEWEGRPANLIFATDITARKQAETSLQFQYGLVSSLLNSIPDLVFYKDREGVYLGCNPEFARHVGRSQDEVLGKTDYDLYDREQAEVFRANDRKVIEAGQPLTEEELVHYPNGREILVDTLKAPLLSPEGETIGVVGVARDITERKRSEQKLRESESKWRNILVHTPQIGIALDPEARIAFANKRFLELTGWGEDEVLGQNWFDLCIPADVREEVRVVFDTVLYQRDTSGLSNYENEILTKSGERLNVAWSNVVTKDATGAVTDLTCLGIDLTERKRAERALQESERRYRSIAENFPNGAIFFIDRNLRYTLAGGGSFEAVGLNPADVVGRTIDEVFPPSVSEVAVPAALKMLSGEPCRYEVVYQDRIFSNDGVPIFDDNGDVTEALVIVQDITDRKAAEEALRESEQQKSMLLNSTAEMFAHYDLELTIQWANEAAGRSVGMKAEDLIGKKCYEIWHGRSEPCPECPVLKSLKNKKSNQTELQTPDGRWWFVRGYPVLDEHGEVTGLIEFGQDISDRKRAEEALRLSEERLRFAHKATNDVVWDWDIVNDTQRWNEAGTVVFGWTEIVERPVSAHWWVERVHPEDRQRVDEGFFAVVNNPDTDYWTDEYRFLKADGNYATVLDRGYVIRDAGGKAVRMIGAMLDITDRKRAEEALRESEGRVRAKLDAILSPEGDLEKLDLADVINAEEIQALMDEFYALTNIGVGIIDLEGRVLVGTGWQDICTKFHRVHPDTCRNCLESDLKLSAGGVPGSFKVYKCKNNMWDIATPIHVGDHLIGNLFLGQFFYSDEEPDRELFRMQARMYGFDEDEYLGALDRVPRWSEQTINNVMAFYARFATLVSKLSFSNLKLARSLEEQKRVEQALVESEERFDLAMRGSNDGFWDWPDVSDTSYVWWSPRMFELMGYEPDEVTPSFYLWLSTICPVDRDRIARAVQDALDKGLPYDVEYRMEIEGGGYRWLRAKGVVLRTPDGQPRRMSGSMVDITETKRLQELESRAQRLETAGSIAGQVAHDFNNLLAPLTAYPDLIKEYLDPEHPAYGFIQDMERAAQQIADINQQLLTLGRRGHYQQEPLIINEVVEQVVRQMPQMPRTLHVDLRLAEDLMYIKAGRSQLFRALTNLINNAREAMQDMGRLTITSENFYVDDLAIRFGRIPKGEYVKLTVSDTGCGIPEDIRSRIFDPFFTTKAADKKRGSGLGVSVVDAVVRDHQGYIDLASVEGEGTSFYLYFPITRETPTGDSVAEVTGGNESVLIVDDDQVQRDVTQELLTRLGYRVVAAASGEEALRLLGSESVDLMLLDMIMPPGIDGAETYRRALEIAPGQKALLVSGFAESDRVEVALKLGADAFVRKPLSRQSLAVAVRRALDRQLA